MEVPRNPEVPLEPLAGGKIGCGKVRNRFGQDFGQRAFCFLQAAASQKQDSSWEIRLQTAAGQKQNNSREILMRIRMGKWSIITKAV